MISSGWQTFFLLDTSNMLPSRLVKEKLRGRKLKRMQKVGPTHVHRMDAPGSFNDHQALNDSSHWRNAPHHWKGFPCYTRLRQYASLFREGMATMPTLQSTSPLTTVGNVAQEGWASRSNEKQKNYLET